MAHFKSGSSGGICIYTRTQIWTGTSHWRAVKKRKVLGNQVFKDGETGTGAFFRGSSRRVCVCVFPERKKGDGWMDGLETFRGNVVHGTGSNFQRRGLLLH